MAIGRVTTGQAFLFLRRLEFKWFGMMLILALVWGGNSYAQSKIKATVIDRLGNAHEVAKFAFQDRTELEYYVGATRQVKPLKQIERIVFEGNRGDEEQTISVHLRTGNTEVGSILTGGNAAPRAHGTFGSGRAEVLFTGVSKLGPFLMRLNEVREVKIRHPPGEPLVQEKRFKAVIVTVKGERFEVSNLRYLGKPKFYFKQGRMGRSIPIHKIEKIDFFASQSSEEKRPVTIALQTGKILQGTVAISHVRLPGETDRNYYTRLNEVFTGTSPRGYFAIGLQDVKQIRFRLEGDENISATEPKNTDQKEVPEEGEISKKSP